MKSRFLIIGFSALAACLVCSCNKDNQELESSNEEVVPVKMVTFNFAAEKAGDESKTQAVVGASTVSYQWTDDDISNLKLFTVDGSSLTEVASPIITKVSPTRLTISATVPEAATYTFRAILAREYYAKGQPIVSKYQSPKTDNYDPKGDILFSDDKVVVTDGTSSGELLLTFDRKVAVTQMTLKGLPEGEKISRIDITSTKGLVGYYDGTSIVETADSNTIVLSYNNEEIPASGEFPVFFTAIPNSEQNLVVKVTTDAKTYIKPSFGPLTFEKGYFLQFGATMPAGVAPSGTWNRVTSAAQLADGDVIVITNTAATKALSTTQNDANRSSVSITASSDKTRLTDVGDDVQRIVLEASGENYYLKVGDKYLYAPSSSANQLKSSSQSTASDNGKWKVTYSEEIASIVAQGTSTRKVLQYYSSSGLFSCYETASQTAVAIYKFDPTVWNLKSLTVSSAPTKTTYKNGDDFDPSGLEITATFEDNASIRSDRVITIPLEELTFSPNVLSVAETKVQVSFLGKTVDVTGLTVNPCVYKVISTLDKVQAGSYLIGSNNSDTFAASTSFYLWDGTIASDSELKGVSSTWDNTDSDFSTVTGVASVVLESAGSSNVWYIKVGDKYLAGAAAVLSLQDAVFPWTFINDGTKEGVYFQNTEGDNTTTISRYGGTLAAKAYNSTTKYKGLFLFKKL